MKAKVIFLAMVMLALCRPADAEYRMDYSRWDRWAASQGAGTAPQSARQGPCIYARKEDCENAKKEAARQYGDNSIMYVDCVLCSGSGGSSGGSLGQLLAQSVGDLISSGNSGGSPEQQVAASLAEAIVGSLFSKKQKTSSQAEIEGQNAFKLQQAEELEKQRQLQLQRELEFAQQKKFAEEKNQLLGAFKDTGEGTLGLKGDGPPTSELKFKKGTGFFGTSKPTDVTLRPQEDGDYPTSKFSAIETLRGTAYFFTSALDAAARDGDYEKAAYLGSQADKVIQGQPTSMKVNFASIPDVPEPLAPEQVSARKQEIAALLQTFQKNVNSLMDIEVKLIDTKAQIKEAESKKEVAQTKLEEAKNIAATAKPEEKLRADELEAQAMAALQSADDELDKAKQSENDIVKEKEKIENEVKNMNAKIQAGGK